MYRTQNFAPNDRNLGLLNFKKASFLKQGPKQIVPPSEVGPQTQWKCGFLIQYMWREAARRLQVWVRRYWQKVNREFVVCDA